MRTHKYIFILYVTTDRSAYYQTTLRLLILPTQKKPRDNVLIRTILNYNHPWNETVRHGIIAFRQENFKLVSFLESQNVRVRHLPFFSLRAEPPYNYILHDGSAWISNPYFGVPSLWNARISTLLFLMSLTLFSLSSALTHDGRQISTHCTFAM